MTINKDNNTVTMPQREYDRIQKEVENKRDRILSIRVYMGSYNREAIVFSNSLEQNMEDPIELSKLMNIEKVVEGIAKEQQEETNRFLRNYYNELNIIKRKWWYKLFNRR